MGRRRFAKPVEPGCHAVGHPRPGATPIAISSGVRAIIARPARPWAVIQAAPAALEISKRAYLIQKGQVVYEGDAKKLLSEVDVLRSAYLGAGPKARQAPALRR